MADQSKKRKQPPDTGGSGVKRPRFPQRPQHQIHTQPTKTAYPNGEVNVKNFLKSHENEIKALENGMRAAKKGLTRRAFQDVPRELRRRTASHNPQRVPKRLRARSKQEAKEDNTPISRGTSGSGVGKGGKGHLRKEGREKSKQKGKERAKRKAGIRWISMEILSLRRSQHNNQNQRSPDSQLLLRPQPRLRDFGNVKRTRHGCPHTYGTQSARA
jgi:ribonuclease P/MRP protein subunit POP1